MLEILVVVLVLAVVGLAYLLGKAVKKHQDSEKKHEVTFQEFNNRINEIEAKQKQHANYSQSYFRPTGKK
jgi:Tfp pilus assembly protein PilV